MTSIERVLAFAVIHQLMCSCNEDTGTSSFLDSLLGSLGEKLGFDDEWLLWQVLALSENLHVSVLGDIDDWDLSLLHLLGFLDSLSAANEGPEFVGVDDWGPLPVSLHVEHSDTALSVVS